MARRNIDRQALRQQIQELDIDNELKTQLLEAVSEQKKYGLVWENHVEDVEEELREKLPVLVEDEGKRLDKGGEDAPNHVLIEGDNLHALTALTYTHEGRVDVIYIDPPYNTGNKDFVYNDSFVDSEDGYRHSKWLSFMEKRLRIAKRLLSDRGVIFISIDDNEQANLKLLCDEVFGIVNYQATITYVRKTSGKQDSSNFVKSTEYILVYSKNLNWIAAQLLAEEKVTDRYNKTDESGRKYRETDLRKTGNADRRIDRPFMFYPFYLNKITNELLVFDAPNQNLDKNKFIEILPIKPDNTEGRWRWAYSTSKENLDKLIAKEMPKYKGKYTIYEKDYIDKKEETRTIKEHTCWDRKPFNSDNAMMDFKELGFGNQDFPFPKSTDLIQHIVFLSNCPNGMYLDFFAGSGTTLQALMRQNAEDGGHRKCILVTNNENNICEEVTYERNKRVINGYTTPKGVEVPGLTNNNLRYYKTAFVERESTATNRKRLMQLSTDQLCIKENIFNEQPFTIGGKTMKKDFVRYFAEGDNRMLVVYDPRAISYIVEELRNREDEGVLKVYVYSDGQYAYNDEFSGLNVELCALPDAIYQALNRVLPEKKEVAL